MRVIVCDNYEELSLRAATLVSSQIILKPDSVLGLATGSTPIGLYNNLVKMYEAGELDFSEITTFNLDEYYHIKKSNPQSYDYFMNEHLFSKINIDRTKTHIPNGETDNPQKECENYENLIKQSGGVDLQILGIGQNGHIGFNEPDACLNSFTHLTNLTENTINANSRFFGEDEEIPTQAITMGISTILKAKKIVLLANGASKNRVVSELLNDEINTSIPATMLKTHPDVVLICDKEAYLGARLGVDIGGTNIKFAVVEEDEIKYKNIIKTANTQEQLINDIADECMKVKELYNVKTVGVGTPGYIKNGKVTAINLPFCDTPLAKLLMKKTGMSVSVENDANCAALGEVDFGAAVDCDNMILITLGTGVGGGIIMNRQICRGNNSMGEIGHMIIEAENGKKCACGQHGCFEQYASATALIKSAEDAAEGNEGSILHELYMKNDRHLDGELIFEAIDKNCSVANEVFEKYLNYLAVGIKSLENIFGPDAIILAGGITAQGDKLLRPLRKRLPSNIRIEISTLQNDAGALGAAML